MSTTFHVICFYVPISHAEAVKSAMFAAGAGRIGNYDCCAWQTAGQGQFRPLDGSAPFVGKQGRLEQVEELKVEMAVQSDCLEAVVAALRQAHPYETPAYHYWQVQG